jgi:ABC-2 type transport system ATP-binding protein
VTVSCSALGKTFDEEPVVRDLALEVEEGSIVGLIGPSGCGKTTTVRLLVGLLQPTTGWATIWRTPSTELSSSQRGRIGYLPQIPALFPDLSLWENLSFHASMYGLRLRRRRRLHDVLRWVELDDHRRKRVREVSGGMQRRLALAAALVHDPALIFLDEPTAGIDPILRSAFWDHFRMMRDEGRTIIMTTQYVGEAAHCDAVGLLSDGELLLVDTPANLRRAAFDGEVVDVEFGREVDESAIRPLATIAGVRARPEQLSRRVWRLVVDDADAAIERLDDALTRSDLPIVETREHVVDFDEAFVRLIERHRAGPAAPPPGSDDVDAGVAMVHQ